MADDVAPKAGSKVTVKPVEVKLEPIITVEDILGSPTEATVKPEVAKVSEVPLAFAEASSFVKTSEDTSAGKQVPEVPQVPRVPSTFAKATADMQVSRAQTAPHSASVYQRPVFVASQQQIPSAAQTYGTGGVGFFPQRGTWSSPGSRPGFVRRNMARNNMPMPGVNYGQNQNTMQLSQPMVNSYEDDRLIPDANLPTETIDGVLDMVANGNGYLRPAGMPSDRDVYISSSQIRRFSLRPGDMVTGQARKPKENERYWGLLKVEKVNGVTAEEAVNRPAFDQLKALFPSTHIKLETEADVLSTRIIDLICPIGFGQRGLIVSPPKAGKTWLLKDIATGVGKNYSEAHLMAVLIGERPEEVTDIINHVATVTGDKGQVFSSNFDESPGEQTHIAELALERAKRLVEAGRDVVIILDSITRLARAYNLAMPTSGRTLSGGFDPAALFPAKHFFGAARNIENGGSLTIIGTALIDTGSRMDDLIYEEFKGTGNLELHLDRRLAERRVFPAIDIQRSGTRQEELLYGKEIYSQIVTMRRMIDILSQDERTEVILERLRKSKSNAEFLKGLTKGG